jgi:glycosyltransferase involved in cell wall biosynthesis
MIALDVHAIGQRETGNEIYTLNLARSLLRAAPETRFGLFTPHPERLPAALAHAANAEVMRVWPGNSFGRVTFSLPLAVWRHRAALLHVNYILPPVRSCPGVVTVHDLSYDLFPEDAPPRDRLVLGPLLPLSMRNAAAVIVVSQNTRRDLLTRFPDVADRLTVIYEACPEGISQVNDADQLGKAKVAYGLRDPYVLAVGNLQPRKNLVRLTEAFAIVRTDGLARQLVIVGQGRWRQSQVMCAVRRQGLQDDVLFTGFVPDDDLPALYSGAAVFAYPSLYEGFGLPLLEAMTCGTPVVSSNTSSMPEVAGDAALLVDPRDVGALAAALGSVLSRPDLAAELRARSRARASQFSWEKAARSTLAVYERVLAKQRAVVLDHKTNA